MRIAHLAAVVPQCRAHSLVLPDSLPELLILRARWTVEKRLLELERYSNGWLALEREEFLRDLETLEEQTARWLDRFDVIEEEPAATVREFLSDLEHIDGQLAVLSLLAGRQRPHEHRLAQALDRLGD